MGEADRDATRKAFSKPAAFVLLARGLTLTNDQLAAATASNREALQEIADREFGGKDKGYAPRPNSGKPVAILGRNFCGAVAHATGISLVRTATVDSEHDGLTIIRLEFIATEEQSRLIGEFLARGPGAPA